MARRNDADPTSGPFVSSDLAKWSKKKDLRHLYREALKNPKVSVLSITRDYWRLSRGHGRLTLHDYFRYRLYRPELTESFKTTFISDTIHSSIRDKCSSIYWRATTEDK